MNVLARLYAGGAAWRRAWYARHPGAQRALGRRVISVGNLTVGGSGKTPVVAALARLLLAQGERPSILTRGYARRRGADGVVIVSDRERVLEPVSRSGDEPQMLARALPGVPVLAASDRFLAGRIAERRFGCTVHLLDDGFQHVQLRRDLDLLLVAPEDLHDEVLPAGRLREPIAAAAAADAVLVAGTDAERAEVAAAIGAVNVFRVSASFELPRRVVPFGTPRDLAGGSRRTLAVAGIARPQRFFAAARAQGFDVVQEMAFPDHHWFTPGDLARIVRTAASAEANMVLTTEKDAVRLEANGALSSEWFAYLPMTVAIEPAAAFADFVRARG